MATIANIIKNINIGDTDISNIGDGTLTGAIDEINDNQGGVKLGIENGQYGYYNSSNEFVNFKKPTGDAVPVNVLQGKTFSNSTATGLQGSMVNNGTLTTVIKAGETQLLSQGYYSGGSITAETLANQTTVQSGSTAAAAPQILAGYQAWVNGSSVVGTMPNNGTLISTINSCTTYSINPGYYVGGTVSGQVLNGNAVATQVYYGKTFYNNSSAKLTGSMTTHSALKTTAAVGSTVAIEAGYYPASTVLGPLLANMGNAAANHVYAGKTFYSSASGSIQTGSMATNGTLITSFSAATNTAGANANLIAKTNKAGYYANGASVSISPSTHSSTGVSASSGSETIKLKPGYYNAVTINKNNAYNAGTASVALKLTKVGSVSDFGYTNPNQGGTSQTGTTTINVTSKVTKYTSLTVNNFFFKGVTCNAKSRNAAEQILSFDSYNAQTGVLTVKYSVNASGGTDQNQGALFSADIYCAWT